MRCYKHALYSGLSGLAIAGLCVLLPSTSRPQPAKPPASRSATVVENRAARSRLVESYGKLPLRFEANDGQTDQRVKFLARGLGYTLFLTGNEAVLDLGTPKGPSPRLGKSVAQRSLLNAAAFPPFSGLLERPQGRTTDPALQEPARTLSMLRMKLVGANPAATVTALEQLPGKSNYFIGNDPKKWRTHVPTYGKVKYEGVYPGIDLAYYGGQSERSGDPAHFAGRQLEYDFVLAPGADPKAIRLGVETANARIGNRKSKIGIDASGDLVIKTDSGEASRQRKTGPRSHWNRQNQLRWPSTPVIAIWA